jgi:hypothetical protein
MKSRFAFFCIFFVAANGSMGQSGEIFTPTRPAQNVSTNVISFEMPASKVTRLHEARGEKLNFNIPIAIVNGDSIRSKHIRIRGTTSSYLRRKSLNISLEKGAVFHTPHDKFSIAKFYAISMNMDKNYIRNRISCKVLDKLGIKIPSSAYANVLINGKTEGLYLIFDPPEQFAITGCAATMVIRRGYNEAIEDLEYSGNSKEEATSLRKKFQAVYKDIIQRYHGEQLYEKLSEVLDMNAYFTWLSFNHLFNNGDYSDELFLMWNPIKSKFEIIPWDFDDILHPQPHEGLEKRNAILHDKLIFSSEDALDVAIAKDDVVYMKYLFSYQQMLERLSPVILSEILNGVYEEIYPYYLDPAIIAQSQYDQGGLTDLSHLEEDLRNISGYINLRVVTHRKVIDSYLTR